MLAFLNRLSAFILYFHVAEIVEVFAFMMAFALLESLLVTGLVVMLSITLPSRWLRDGFAYKGLVLVVAATAVAILFQRNLEGELPPPQILMSYGIAPVALAVIIIGVVQKWSPAQRTLLNLADRLAIMVFLYVPIGGLSLIVLMLGNLF